MWRKVKGGKVLWGFKEIEASVRLISHGGPLPCAVQAVAVLTDEAGLWVTCDGPLTKVLSAPFPHNTHTPAFIITTAHHSFQFLSTIQFPISPTSHHWRTLGLFPPASPIITASSCSPLSLLFPSTSSHSDPANLSHPSPLSSSTPSRSVLLSLRRLAQW